MKKVFVLIFVLLFLSCKKQNPMATDVVAKVYDYELTKTDLQRNLPSVNTVVDSLRLREDYIKNWAKQKILYRNAIINLGNTEQLDELVNKYKEELYVTYYKNALVNKKLDTLVLQKEIDSFYVKNKQNFKLNETLVKLKYIHINPNNKKRNIIKKLFLSSDIEDKQEILKEHSGYNDFYLNDSTWVSLENIYTKKPEFPLLTLRDLKIPGRLIEKREQDKSYYYVYLQEVLNTGDIAPQAYVNTIIKEILIEKNKLKFFNQMEQILIDDAVKQNKYEVR